MDFCLAPANKSRVTANLNSSLTKRPYGAPSNALGQACFLASARFA
jgi:hypothetical protein